METVVYKNLQFNVWSVMGRHEGLSPSSSNQALLCAHVSPGFCVLLATGISVDRQTSDHIGDVTTQTRTQSST